MAHAYSYTHVPAASCVAEAAAGLVAACHQQTGQPHAAPAWESALRTVAVAAAGIARGRDPLDSAVTSMARVVCQVLDHTRPLATRTTLTSSSLISKHYVHLHSKRHGIKIKYKSLRQLHTGGALACQHSSELVYQSILS